MIFSSFSTSENLERLERLELDSLFTLLTAVKINRLFIHHFQGIMADDVICGLIGGHNDFHGFSSISIKPLSTSKSFNLFIKTFLK